MDAPLETRSRYSVKWNHKFKSWLLEKFSTLLKLILSSFSGFSDCRFHTSVIGAKDKTCILKDCT